MILWTTEQYEYMRDDLLSATGAQPGQIERKTFADGETYHRLITDVVGRDVVLVGGTGSDAQTLELFDMACGLVQAGARALTLVLPYLGYATMDRAVKPGEVVKAKTRARLVSAIPHGVQANRIVLLDLHAEGIQYYFEGGSHPVHVYAKPVVSKAIVELGGDGYVLACTDAGRAKWVESLANELNVDASFVFKRRGADGKPAVTGINADVDGRDVVIYDDMVRSGDSLLIAAKAYRNAGATSVSAVTTHGIFPGDAINTIQKAGLIDRMICTDSHPGALTASQQADGFLAMRSVVPVLADAITGGKAATS